MYTDLISGETRAAKGVDVPAYGFFWLKRQPQQKKAAD